MKKLLFILFSLSVIISYAQTKEYYLLDVVKASHVWPVYHVVEVEYDFGVINVSVIDTVTGSYSLLDREAILNVYLANCQDTIQGNREYYIIKDYKKGYNGWFLKRYYPNEGVYVITNPILKKH
jgi:hypothetical protein